MQWACNAGKGLSMRVCIVGAGAIGSFIGARLAATGTTEVSALARGDTLAALNQHGWRVHLGDTLVQGPAHASASASELGVQDLVVIAVKGQALPALAAELPALIGPSTVILPAMNGVPWWFCEGLADFDSLPLHSVDPGGAIARALPLTRVLGCVVHASVFMREPGVAQHRMGHGLNVGEPRGGQSERAQRVVDVLARAGFDVTHSADVRRDIWYKLWGNLTMNPVSALTGATVDRILGDPEVRAFCSATMQEAAAIGARIGCPIAQSPEDRHTITAKLGAFKTSMLQDAEAGRAIELDAIVTAVQEIGQRLALPTPCIDALLGLTRLSARVRGLYPEAHRA